MSPASARASAAETVGLGGLDVAPCPTGSAVDVGGEQLVGSGLGHPGDHLVGLVDHDDVVVGDHRHALDRVDREQGVVGDDQVGAMGLLAGDLDEALVAERAPGGPEALAMVDADLAPLAVGVARGAVALAAALGLGLALGPRSQLEDLLAERARRHVDQRGLVVVGRALADAVQAGVVGPALEHGVRRVDLRMGAGDGLDQAREVALDELVLQCQRGRRDDHAAVVQECGDEVGEGLAGAGAGLDHEVTTLGQGVGHGLGHGDLSGPLLTAQGLDRRPQHVAGG